MAYRVTQAAEEQIDGVLLESARSFGLDIAGRYGELILAIMAALGETLTLNGSMPVSDLGARAYPMRLARFKVAPDRRIGRPRHLVVHRIGAEAIVDILGLVHDRMVLSRATQCLVEAGG